MYLNSIDLVLINNAKRIPEKNSKTNTQIFICKKPHVLFSVLNISFTPIPKNKIIDFSREHIFETNVEKYFLLVQR